MKKNKVFLFAYASGNLGDDLFIKIICERYNNTHFYLIGHKGYGYIYKDLKNLTYIPDSFITKKIYKVIEYAGIFLSRFISGLKIDTLVVIGGSMYIQKENWRSTYDFFGRCLKKYKNIYLIGANFGPYYDDEYLNAYKEYFARFSDVCFRETRSKNLFKELSNVRCAQDIVFQLECPKAPFENYYIISLINCKDRDDLRSYADEYVAKMAQIADEIAQNGHDVLLMGFCAAENDNVAIKDVYERISAQNKGEVKVYRHNNINESMDIIARCKGIVATRFHAMILGFINAKPVYPIIYSKKTTNVLNDINYTKASCEIKNLSSLDASECYKALCDRAHFDFSECVDNSKEHFKELDKLLLKK